MTPHKWTEEEINFLRENYPIYQLPQLLIIFNDHFNLYITKGQLKGILNKYKITCGRSSLWQKGQTAWNKGKTWDEYMSEESQANSRKTTFKNGSLPPNTVPVGTEYDLKGYIVVKQHTKTGDKSRPYWRLKHHIIWEEANGSIPDGYCVIFADGNTRNFDLDNLVLVSNKELLTINSNQLYFKGNADATKCGVTLSKLMIKEKERAKK